MTDERGTVIRDIRSNSNESDDDGNDRENEEEEEVSGVTLPTTLVSSLLHTFNTLLITYRPLIVFTTSQNIQHNIVPISVINSINTVSILYIITINPT